MLAYTCTVKKEIRSVLKPGKSGGDQVSTEYRKGLCFPVVFCPLSSFFPYLMVSPVKSNSVQQVDKSTMIRNIENTMDTKLKPFCVCVCGGVIRYKYCDSLEEPILKSSVCKTSLRSCTSDKVQEELYFSLIVQTPPFKYHSNKTELSDLASRSAKKHLSFG